MSTGHCIKPVRATQDPGEGPISAGQGDSAPVNCLDINTYRAMNSMHTFWGTMKLMVMM